MANRTVELLVEVVDRASAPLAKLRGSFASFGGGMIGTVAGLAGIGLGVSAVAKNMIEADEAAHRFDLAFRNLGAAVGVSKAAMLEHAATTQRATAFSDEAVLDLQSTLMRFGSLTGPMFERTRAVVLDVAAALEMDLGSAANMVGRALENPVQGMRMLRSMGVVLSAEQQELVKNLTETGRTAEAQQLILDELARRYKGAAENEVKTLSGALKQLGNIFGDAFEGGNETVGSLAESVRGLSKTLADPTFKAAVEGSIGALVTSLRVVLDLINQIWRGWQNIAFLFGAGRKTEAGAVQRIDIAEQNVSALERAKAAGFQGPEGTPQRLKDAWLKGIDEALVAARKAVDAANAELFEMQGHGPKAAASDGKKPPPAIDLEELERQKKALAEAKKQWQDTMASIYDAAGSELDKVQRELYETRQAVVDAFGSRLINEDQMHELFRLAGENSGEAFAAAFEAANRPMFDKLTKDMTAELEGAMEGVAVDIPTVKIEIDTEEVLRARAMTDSFIGALTDGLKNAAAQGKLSMKDLVRFMISQLLSKALMNAIDSLGKALKDAFSASSSGGNSWVSGAVSFVGSLFGGKAGGGFAAGGLAHAAAGGMTLVGEEGPELVALPKGSRVYSNSASKAMGQANVNYAPVNNVAIMAKDTDAATLRAEFMVMLERNNERERKKTLEIWDRNGFGRMR